MSREGRHITPIDAHPQDSQKNHEEIIATYRNHLLSAAQVSKGEGGAESWVGSIAFGVPFLTHTYLSFPGKLAFRCSSARSLDLLRYGNVRGRGVCPPFSIPDPL